jgi:thioredoxin reductase (NADPH)
MNHDTIEILGDEQVVTGVKALNKMTEKLLISSNWTFFVAIGHKLYRHF